MSSADATLAVGFTGIGLAFGLLACAMVRRLNVVDAPDGERKSQSAPVPRLGGLAICLGTLFGTVIGFLLLMLSYGVNPLITFVELIEGMVQIGSSLAPAFAFTAFGFLIGLWDDLWQANTKIKLIGLTAGAVLAVLGGLMAAELPTPWFDLEHAAILIIGSAAWLLVMTNATNFMDGSNGLAIGCVTIMLAALYAIGISAGDWGFSVWIFPLFGAVVAFLMHNMRGGLYAGDAGALGLGALFSTLGLASGLEVWTVATLALPFLIDVLLTLVWRARRGRNWLAAHLDHAYQRLIDNGWSHFDVVVLYWGLTACAGAMAYIGAQAGGEAPFLIFWTLTIAGTVIWVRHRRTAKLSDLSS
jgi:UDP-GlcNAc:undecaprenyl-phosphate GlcNAc-1-phosphate transferase